MYIKATSLVALAAGLPQVMGHYVFDRLIANGQTTAPWEYVRDFTAVSSNGPMNDVTDPDLRCNKGSFANAGKTKTMAVKAGDTVGFGINSVLGHPGPLFVYMSKSTTPNVTTYEGDGEWFKIYENGVKTFATYNSALTWSNQDWTSFDFKIPAGIEDGEYLLRAEHIAIHGAGTLLGSQFYMSCAQISVSGGTGAKPSPVGTFPGICKCLLQLTSNLSDRVIVDAQTDPGILFEPYWPPVVNYSMPGLKVYPEGGSYPDFTADPSLPPATAPLPATAGGAPPTAPTPAPPVTSAPAAPIPTTVSTVVSPVSRAGVSISASPIIREVSSTSAAAAPASQVPSGKNCRLRRK